MVLEKLEELEKLEMGPLNTILEKASPAVQTDRLSLYSVIVHIYKNLLGRALCIYWCESNFQLV